MKIVLDSTVLVSNFHMKGPAFRLLEWFLVNREATLVVPQIVTAEVKNKYREMINEQFDKGTSEIKKLSNLLDHDLDMPISVFDLNDSQGNYERRLEAKLTALNAEMPGHDDIPQQDIIDRDLARLKPFRRIGKNQRDSTGYRDTLLWEVILRKVAPETDLVVLVTANTKDFWDQNIEEVHHHLRRDLIRRRLKPDCVTVCDSIDSFNKKYVKPEITVIEEAKILLEQGRYHEFSILSWFDGNTKDLISEFERNFNVPLSFLHLEIDGVTITHIEDPSDLAIDGVYELGKDLVLIEVSLEAAFSLDFYVHNFFLIDDIDEFPFDVSVEETDKYGAWVAAYIRLPINMSLTFNVVDKKVEEFEGRFVEIFGWCRFCGEPFTSDAAERCPKCGM